MGIAAFFAAMFVSSLAINVMMFGHNCKLEHEIAELFSRAERIKREREKRRRESCGKYAPRNRAKVTPEQVYAIRKQYDQVMRIKDRFKHDAAIRSIAVEYGLHKVTIRQIGRRKSWKHLSEKENEGC